MTQTQFKGINTILPFSESYILVGKKKYYSSKSLMWNLMDAAGNLVSETWFSSITKNSDGSIKTEVKPAKAKKAVATTFLNVKSFAQASKVMDLVPVACLSLVDSGSVVAYTDSDEYVAKAKLYGRTVYLDKDGNIYDDSGNKLSLLFNTVDSERIYNAIKAFNHKMHYDHKQCTEDDNSYEGARDNKLSMWGFYFVSDDWTVMTDMEELGIRGGTHKWTDDFIVRILRDLVPEKVRNALDNAFGSHKSVSHGKDDIVEWTWHLGKNDVDKFINTLAAI